MDQRKELENYLERLKDLDRKLSDNTDEGDLVDELTSILNGISNATELPNKLSVELKFKNESNNPDPVFAHEGDSGFDLRAFVDKDITINEGRVAIIPTGLYFEVEKGLEIQARTRSGIAANANMFVLNSPGTIDSHFRGEVKIILANLSDIPRTIRNGDRIAQGVVCPVYGEGILNMIKVDKLSETKRNNNGFGSSGVS